MLAKDGAKDAEAAAFTGQTLSPVRLTARYLFRVEDMAVFPGLEDVLRRDLRRQMSDEMDNQIVNGDGTAPNVSGLLAELSDPTAPTAVVTYDSYVSTWAGLVDGETAFGLSDIAGVIGATTFAKVASTFRNGANVSADAYVRQQTAGIRVSSRIPAAASNVQQAIASRNSYPGSNAVAPIWRAFDLIRDNVTNAAKGQIAITALALWNFKVLREAAWKQIAFKIA